MNRTALVCTALASAALVGSAALVAGPLTPPSGPVASTYKTLSEVEPRTPISSLPFTITQPGSYYLTATLVNNNFGVDSIRINTTKVTLDLNGFSIVGGARGVGIDPAASNVTIRNGSISGGGDGIAALPGAGGVLATGTSVIDVTMDGTVAQAIALGDNAVVDRVTIVGQPATFNRGVSVGRASRVTSVTVEGVNGPGFALGEGTVASACVANTIYNGDGFLLDARVRVTDSIATNINGHGFSTNTAQQALNNIMSVVIDRCTVSNVALNGVQLLGNNGMVTNCSISNAGFFSTYVGAQTGGVLVTGTGNRIDSNRFFRVSYPVFLGNASAQSTVVRNVASTVQFGYTNDAPAASANRIATVSSAIPTGPWDNMLQ